MSKKHLKLEPHQTEQTNGDPAWWYEDVNGIDVYVETNNMVCQVFIPWRDIRAALKRKDNK